MGALEEFVRPWLPEPPAEVLDVGCGGGRLTRWLRELGYEALGLDPDPPAGPGFIRGTLAWLEQQGLGPMLGKDEHEHLVELGTLRELLERRLRPLHFERTPYLAIEYGRLDLWGREAAAIGAGEIPAIGARLVLERD